MKTKTQNLLSKKQFIIGLAAILIVGIVGASIFQASASSGESDSEIWVRVDLNTYSGREVHGTSITVERWKYTIRDDDTCDNSVFTDNGQDANNLIEVVYGSDSYTPADKNEIAEFDGQYVCFAGIDGDDTWHHAGRQLNWINRVNPDDPVSPEDEDEDDCDADEVATPDGDCVLDTSEEDPCDSEDDNSAECQAFNEEHAEQSEDAEDDNYENDARSDLQPSDGNYIFFDGGIYEFDDDYIFTDSDGGRWTYAKLIQSASHSMLMPSLTSS